MAHRSARGNEPARRNWIALSSLWLVGASWLALLIRFQIADILSIDSLLDWFYVGLVAGGVIAGLAGLVAIKWRGHAVLAMGAFLFSLLLPVIYAIVFWPGEESVPSGD